MLTRFLIHKYAPSKPPSWSGLPRSATSSPCHGRTMPQSASWIPLHSSSFGCLPVSYIHNSSLRLPSLIIYPSTSHWFPSSIRSSYFPTSLAQCTSTIIERNAWSGHLLPMSLRVKLSSVLPEQFPPSREVRRSAAGRLSRSQCDAGPWI